MLEKLLNTLDPFYSPYTLTLTVAFLAILGFALLWIDVFMKDKKEVYKKSSLYFYCFRNYCVWFVRNV